MIIYFLVFLSFWPQIDYFGIEATTSAHHNQATSFNEQAVSDFYALKAEGIDGSEFDFSALKGTRVLIVNTASQCGYTPQYEGLQKLYEQYGGEKFTIIGFPSNDFGKQEPGSNSEIEEFCQKNFGVSFKMMAKTPVTGSEMHPVYDWLTKKTRNGRSDAKVGWNFNKFLIDEAGQWVAHYPSSVKPLDDRIIRFASGAK